MRRTALRLSTVFLASILPPATWTACMASQVFLKDGRVLEGSLGTTSSVAEAPQPPQPDGSGPLQLILLVDDELRRIFISKRQLIEVRQEDASQVLEKFRLRQPTLESGQAIMSLGQMVRDDPFDEYGRRKVTFNSPRGPINIIQSITELTPVWAKVEGFNYVWDMRMATNSLPRDILAKILYRQIDPKSVEDRKRIARFYLQAERYEDADAELQRILNDFASERTIKEQLEPSIRAIKQLSSNRYLVELQRRREAGQHQLVQTALQKFPTDNVAGEILQTVRDMIREYDQAVAQREEVVQQYGTLGAQVQDAATRQQLDLVGREIAAELNIDTMARMAAFRQMVKDENLPAAERLALAVSGWLVGANAATSNLPVAVSLYEVRELICQYMKTPDQLGRTSILQSINSQRASAPSLVAAVLAQMKPPLDPPEPSQRPGFYEWEVPGIGGELPVRYAIQLPPDYNPLRRYPTIFTLHGAGSTPELQIDWWAGRWTEQGWRAGQATRYGYIVIAPQWAASQQRQYGYSAQEHAAVLFSLRDACRRFAIDTDRVFLSGHSMGGDAAWDIGLAHPDLWAGVIPVVAVADRYCARYWKNAAGLPFYLVCGELDGGKMKQNATDLDRYLRTGYNATVVEFQGRGHENFSDEILKLFDWMGRLKRDFFPREFMTASMRPWDNFFWWVELRQLPARCMVDPIEWPPPRSTVAMETTASVTKTGSIYVKTGADKVTVWLSPEMIDFQQRPTITVNGQKLLGPATALEPSLETILEDARTRGDRQHPFWVKLGT